RRIAMTLDDIVKEIHEAKDIIILTHDIPDGDAVGSSLALYLGLKQLNKTVDVVIPEYSETFKFLPGVSEIKKQGKEEIYDLAIALDSGDVKRLNGFSKYFENSNCRIQIDHHKVNTMFADYNFVNPTSPACGQVLIVVLTALRNRNNKRYRHMSACSNHNRHRGFQVSGCNCRNI
ncbi:MAG: DHH family phosphoesterase, partial [Firmicutes bacterium]|nr:DHH family phosphoesterase [Bacillota bacterium]